MMKRLSLAIIFACWTLAMAAQDAIEVRFLGTYPDIVDFAWSLATANDDNEEGDVDESRNAVKAALERYRTGEQQPEGMTITVDKKAGYMLLESRQDGFTLKWEMCYWNMADKKHKLFAYCVELSENGKRSAPGQYDCLDFYRYDNATRMMSAYDAGFEVDYFNTSYSLPRTGKDITVTQWSENGREKWQKTLKWDGSRFSY